MLYFFEIGFRLFYFCISLILTFIIIFLNRYNNSFLILYYNSFDFDDQTFLSYTIDKTFSCRSPIDLFDFDFKYSLLICIISLIPYIIWNIYFFINTSLNNHDLKNIKVFVIEFSILFYLLNYLFYSKFFKFFWAIFEYININDSNIYFINIDYDLNLLYLTKTIINLYTFFNIIFVFSFLFTFFLLKGKMSFFFTKRYFLLKYTILFVFIDFSLLSVSFLIINIIYYVFNFLIITQKVNTINI